MGKFNKHFLGIDFGTSGARACIINQNEDIVFECTHRIEEPLESNGSRSQSAEFWWTALLALFKKLSHSQKLDLVKAICINGTSGTVVHCDSSLNPIAPALMYNDTSSATYVDQIKLYAPEQHVTLSASSGLAKMLHLFQQQPIHDSVFFNQGDWLCNKLTNVRPTSDYNNALKMGYDCETLKWPKWIKKNFPFIPLPKVVAPGKTLGKLHSTIAKQFGFNLKVKIKAGTTDSIAAFLATTVNNETSAVTSLGSTLAIKMMSQSPINESSSGIYSHKLGRYWLVGGASNTGGRVLRQYFNNQQLKTLSTLIDPVTDSGLNYYPLIDKGERFPINDANKLAQLNPRPDKDEDFLKGIFEGIAHIEKLSYDLISSLGAHYPERIVTCGGGAQNTTWNAIRQRILHIPVRAAHHQQASYGSALLAKNELRPYL